MATGVGMGFDLDALDKAIVKADNNLRKLAQDAEVQSKRISDAFSIGAAKGISQFAKEIANARGGISKLMAEGAEFKFTANGAKGFSAKVIDEINKVINYSRKEFENLNATITRSMLIKPTLDVNSIKELENRLVILNQGLATGQLGQGKGKKKIAVDDDLRVRINDEIKAINERLSLLRMSTAQFNQMKAQEATAIINNVKLEQEAIEAGKRRAQEAIQNYKRELDAARNAYKQRQQMYEQMWREIERRESSNRRGEYQNAMLGGAGGLKSADQAMRYADRIYSDRGLLSINNMQKAIQQMQQAQNRLNLNTEEGRKKYDQLSQRIKTVQNDINRATNASEEFNKKQKGVLDTAGQLKRALAAAFSVSAIKGYVNKLIEVRGEFEMQQRSLQVLLQNKEKADELWSKTVELAVKSPLTTQQLVTSTKQLAAYRIEHEKLYETNKMLADVSQGLGVDMNRLILAFGQVKAANFLRGTELRQFSEAGVNLLDELAKRFSEIEGRVVSVGDVFERVSKRMVKFEDVEAVFKTITSEGGIFYKMQEKQSETLRGMVLNLKDSYSLMMNDIGKQNDSVIKNFIKLIRNLINNWRKVAPIIKTVGTTILVAFSARAIASFRTYLADVIVSLKQMRTATNGVAMANAGVAKSNPYVFIASCIALVVTGLKEVITYTSKYQDAMTEIEMSATTSLMENIYLYKELAETIRSATASEEEREKATKKMQNALQDILPDEYLELEYINAKVDGYEAAEQAMRAYYEALETEQKKTKARELLTEEVTTDTSELINAVSRNLFIQRTTGKITHVMQNEIEAVLPMIINQMLKELEGGTLKADKGAIDKYIRDNIKNITGHEVNFFEADVSNLMSEKNAKTFQDLVLLTPMLAVISKLKENGTLSKTVGILSLYHEQIKDLAKDYEEFQQNLEIITGESNANAFIAEKEKMKRLEEIYSSLVKYEESLLLGAITLEQYEDKINSVFAEVGYKYQSYEGLMIDFWKKIGEAGQDGFISFQQEIKSVTSHFLQAIEQEVNEIGNSEADFFSKLFINLGEKYKKNAEKALGGTIENIVLGAYADVRDELKLTKDEEALFKSFLPTEKSAVGDIRKALEGKMTQLQSDLKAYKNSLKAGLSEAEAMELHLAGRTEQQVRRELEIFTLAEQKLGGDGLKDKDKNEKLKKQIELIRKMADAYEEMWEKYGKAYADAHIYSAARTAAFDEAELNIKDFSVGGRIDEKNNLAKLVSETSADILAKESAIAEVEVEIKAKKSEQTKEEMSRLFESMFGDYEVSIEMDELHLPKDFAERMYGFKTTSLDDIRKETLKRYGLENLSKLSNKDIMRDAAYLALDDASKDQIAKNFEFIEKETQKRQKKLADEYVKYARKTQEERIKIKLEEARKLKDIDELVGATNVEKELYKSNVRRESAQKMAKAEWDEFTKTPYIVQMFDNLDNIGTQALDGLSEKLKTLKDDLYSAGLPASELKEILDKINKVEDELNKRNPFRGLGEGFKNIFGGLAQARKEYSDQIKKQESADLSYSIWVDAYNDFIKTYGEFGGDPDAKKTLEVQMLKSKKYAEQMQKETDKVSQKYDEATKSVSLFKQRISDAVEQTKQLAQSAIDIADSYGAFSEKGSKEVADSAMGIVSGATGILQAGVKFATFDWVGGVTSLITGITQLIIGINQTGDAMKQMKIEKELKLVQTLEKEYEKLAKAIETAYSIDYIKQYNQEMMDSLDQQIEARKRMIALEESKKKTDKEAITGWKDEIDDLLEKRDEAEKEYLQKLGGIGGETEYGDIISDFVDAWLDGFLEVGDGLDALNEHFDDFIKNIVSKQLAARVVSSSLQGILTHIDKSIANDGIFDKDEWEKLMKQKEEVLPQLNEALSQILEEFGATEWAGKQKELGSLSGSISNISEETADVLAGYLNSIRFFVADSNTQLKALVTAQGLDTDAPNPMLSQLLVIAEQTRAIRDLFDSVVVGGHKMGRSGIKVFID